MKLTLRVPADVLSSVENDLLMLLRLGAGVNALESTARLLVKVGPGGSEVDKLSGIMCVCNGLSFFRELVTTIDKKKYLDRLLQLAGRGLEFSPIKVSLDEGHELLSPEHPDVGGNPLLKVRDKIAFHWDPEAFRRLIEASRGQAIDLWTVSGEPLDRIFTASAYAIAQFTLEVPSEGKSAQDFMNVFVHAVAVIGHVLESAFIGLLIEAGENAPAKYFVKEAS